jgi:hypothetical protein
VPHDGFGVQLGSLVGLGDAKLGQDAADVGEDGAEVVWSSVMVSISRKVPSSSGKVTRVASMARPWAVKA